MIEVLVTLLIISLALLGTAGLQAYSMRLNQGGQFRTQAVFLAADLAERMEANKAAVVDPANANLYAVTGSTATAPAAACSVAAGACLAAALAAADLAQWQFAVVNTLPQSSWTVAQTVTGNPATYTIEINWVDRRADTTNAAYDSTLAGVGSNVAGTGERFRYTATRTIYN